MKTQALDTTDGEAPNLLNASQLAFEFSASQKCSASEAPDHSQKTPVACISPNKLTGEISSEKPSGPAQLEMTQTNGSHASIQEADLSASSHSPETTSDLPAPLSESGAPQHEGNICAHALDHSPEKESHGAKKPGPRRVKKSKTTYSENLNKQQGTERFEARVGMEHIAALLRAIGAGRRFRTKQEGGRAVFEAGIAALGLKK